MPALDSYGDPKRDSYGRGGLHVVECRKIPKTVPDGPPINHWQIMKEVPGEYELDIEVSEHPPECDGLKYGQVCGFDQLIQNFGYEDFRDEEPSPEGKWWMYAWWSKSYNYDYSWAPEWDEGLAWDHYGDGAVPDWIQVEAK